MLRSCLSCARRPSVAMAGATGVIGAIGAASAVTAYAKTEEGLGAKRQIDFWRSMTPVIFDYWWNIDPYSPKVKFYKKWEAYFDKDREITEEQYAAHRNELFRILHERNAPKVFQIMLDLGGLYVKLGQVLSVTMLPLPEIYRAYFRTLQSNVPTHEDFDTVVKPALEKEFAAPMEVIFDCIDKIPVGAASIGQAHRATLKNGKEEVIVKIQYPNARWQVPADIECVGRLLKLCVSFGLVDDSASKLSYDEFSRQFLAELDYGKEKENLQSVHESSLDPEGPYAKRGVVIPKVFDELCTPRVITMTYLPGSKFEDEAKRQLELLGIDTNKGVNSVVKEVANKGHNHTASKSTYGQGGIGKTSVLAFSPNKDTSSWKHSFLRLVSSFIKIDSLFFIARFTRRLMLWSTAIAVRSIQTASTFAVVPTEWDAWAKERRHAIQQAERWNWTEEAIDALLDVHGYQIFNQGLFNADPHPGNILVLHDGDKPNQQPKIGLIDYGQCKSLTPQERVQIAQMMLSVANKESDEAIANHLRNLGIKTKNDSTRFLAEFGRLMFDSLEVKHLDKTWHRDLHKEDRVLYFPKELSMVYRASLLLRGLAISLQFNPSLGEQWRHHAQAVVDQYK